MKKMTKAAALARIEQLNLANRKRVQAFRARKAAAMAKAEAKAARSLALLRKKKAKAVAAHKKRTRAKKRAERIAANAALKVARKMEHEAWLIANPDN